MKNNNLVTAMELAEKIAKASTALKMLQECDAETVDLLHIARGIESRISRMVKMIELATGQ
ncbi:MAG: hypothetical protein LBD55_06265 [Treponema sp.]|jgi:hypothetical protein|nr:hypothetical protein [Treponema sp.]